MAGELLENTSSEYRRDSEKREKILMEELKEKVGVAKGIIAIIREISVEKDPVMEMTRMKSSQILIRTRKYYGRAY